MIRLSLSYFMKLGTIFDRPFHMESAKPLRYYFLDFSTLSDALSGMYSQSSIIVSALRLSLDKASDIYDFLETPLSSPSLDEIFPASELAKLQKDLREFRTILERELHSADAYFVLPKAAFDTNKLILEGEHLWPVGLERKVPEALHDLREAGKCLAFELGTAAGFHILRAMEAVILKYWVAVTDGAALPKNKNMGNYIKKLQSEQKGNEKVLAALTQLKDLHRNSLIHSEDNLTVQEAIGLLGITQSVVGEMLKEIPYQENLK